MKPPLTRAERFLELFPEEKPYRLRQLEEAAFRSNASGFKDVTTFPKDMKEILSEQVPWISIACERLVESISKDTMKAVLRTEDNLRFESVLMANKRDQWTICVSSQIGCAMGCTFCATGAMGLRRNLNADEIADQYRFWKMKLQEQGRGSERISNVVFMGMGEPLGNYENVKNAIHRWLTHTDLGPTRITVSTVGVLMNMERLLTDKDWPPVRIAISLHSANQKKREEIVPTTTPDFLKDLIAWSHKYAAIHGNRRHHITYEYTLLSGVNDTPELAKELASYVEKTAAAKVNVIPWNKVAGKTFTTSARERIDRFKSVLRSRGVDVTERKTMGNDIAAACGQLITDPAKPSDGKRIPLESM
ncbi:MAG TPA: 23S rRNA (adenine(2503)-C(2))-methyltransferase RlmN [Candidatus Peribacterales bacterium]|nr:23S rRNA (adenine(2503)-C(2))-methyltransferase RlmN [Candidatus Peribacterales bacterium]